MTAAQWSILKNVLSFIFVHFDKQEIKKVPLSDFVFVMFPVKQRWNTICHFVQLLRIYVAFFGCVLNKKTYFIWIFWNNYKSSCKSS